MEHFVTQCLRLCYRALHVNIIAIVLTKGETLKTFAPLVCLLAFTTLPTLRALERPSVARFTFSLSRPERGQLLDSIQSECFGTHYWMLQQVLAFFYSPQRRSLNPSYCGGLGFCLIKKNIGKKL